MARRAFCFWEGRITESNHWGTGRPEPRCYGALERRKEEGDADLRQPAELDRPGYPKVEGDYQAGQGVPRQGGEDEGNGGSRAKDSSGDKIRPDGGGAGVKEEVMNEPTMETLARRVDKVERENRWLKVAGRSRTVKRASR